MSTFLAVALAVVLVYLVSALFHFHRKVQQLMALGQDILDQVTEVDTKVGSFITLVQGLIDDNTIPPEIGAAILAKIQGSEDALDAAIAANTPPTP